MLTTATGLTAFTMPYFINSTELDWGGKVGYIWGGSNAITFGTSHISPLLQADFLFPIFFPVHQKFADPPLGNETVFLYLFLPEMRNRTLEEIDELFQERVPTRQFARYHCVSSERAREQAVKNVGLDGG